MHWLAKAVKDNAPLRFNFVFGLWTLTLSGAPIEREFSKKLSLAPERRIMRILGFSTQKPLYQAWQQDAKLVCACGAAICPAIRPDANAVGATIYFADESGVRSDYHTGTTWTPIGWTLVVEVTGRRFSLNMLSVVSLRSEFRLILQDDSINAGMFRDSLKRLMVGAKQPVFLTVDTLPTHNAKLIKEIVAARNRNFKVFTLLPHSPRMSPDERVWARAKRQVSRQLVQSADETRRQALNTLRHIHKLPELVKSLFRQPEFRHSSI